MDSIPSSCECGGRARHMKSVVSACGFHVWLMVGVCCTPSCFLPVSLLLSSVSQPHSPSSSCLSPSPRPKFLSPSFLLLFTLYFPWNVMSFSFSCVTLSFNAPPPPSLASSFLSLLRFFFFFNVNHKKVAPFVGAHPWSVWIIWYLADAFDKSPDFKVIRLHFKILNSWLFSRSND